MPLSFVLNYSGGSLTLNKFNITQDEITYDLNVTRTPYGTNWFSYGTGDELSQLLSVRVPTNTLNGASKPSILSAKDCTSITYNGFTRNTYGFTGNYQEQATNVGYLQTFEIACSAEWSAGAASAGSVSSDISLTHSGGTLQLCSKPPQQSLLTNRSAIRGTSSVRIEGDLGLTPVSLIVEAKAVGSTYQSMWASMVQISNAAKTATRFNFGASQTDLLGLKKLSRRYNANGIYITMEFLASEAF